MKNQEIANLLKEIATLLELKESSFRSRSYHKAAEMIEATDEEVELLYQREGLKGLISIKGVGKSIAEKIEEVIERGSLPYLNELREETAIRQVVTAYFQSKGVSLDQLKRDARKRKIIYARHTRAAKELIELAGDPSEAKRGIEIVSEWANSRNLDYTIETVSKRWLELDKLKPKMPEKKPFYNGNPLVWSEKKKRWFVIDETNTWLEFADTEDKIEWRIEN